MPAITSGLVFVSGASGFLGVYVFPILPQTPANPSHTARALTDAGFTVRAAVRDNTKGAYLQSLVPGVEITLVPDMTAVS